MDSRDDLAEVLRPAFGAAVYVQVPTDVAPEIHVKWLAQQAAHDALAAGWVPGELLAAEQARNATLADTIERVRAVLDENERIRRDRYAAGLHPGTSLVDPVKLRHALDPPPWVVEKVRCPKCGGGLTAPATSPGEEDG